MENAMLKHFDFDNKKDVEIIAEHYEYDGFLKIKKIKLKYRLFSGEWGTSVEREVVVRRPVGAALPYDPIKNKVVLIEQFRVGALNEKKPWLLEIVAGIADRDEEHPDEIIRREIQEETGLQAKNLHRIYEYWVSPGGSNEFLTLYCAEIEAPEKGGVYGLQEENEDIYVHILDTAEAFELLAKGEIKNAITLIALQWLQLHQQEINRLWKGEKSAYT